MITAEHKIIRELDAAWSDLLRIRLDFELNRWDSYEARYNAYGYQQTALRAIDRHRAELDTLRADRDAFTARVDRLAGTATAAGDPLLTALGYLAHGAAILTPA